MDPTNFTRTYGFLVAIVVGMLEQDLYFRLSLGSLFGKSVLCKIMWVMKILLFKTFRINNSQLFLFTVVHMSSSDDMNVKGRTTFMCSSDGMNVQGRTTCMGTAWLNLWLLIEVPNTYISHQLTFVCNDVTQVAVLYNDEIG